MKPPFLSLILILCHMFFATAVFSQTDSITYYFDSNANLSAKADAYYIAKGVKDKTGLRLSFYVEKTNVLVMEATYTDSTLEVKNGRFSLYSEDGSGIIKTGNYIENKEDGYWVEWSEGKLTDSVLFQNGADFTRIVFNYYSNGNLNTRIYNDPVTRTSEVTVYRENGALQRHASWINGTGIQTTYYPTGQIEMVEVYKNKNVTSTKYFTPEGSEISQKEMRKTEEKLLSAFRGETSGTPEYPGGSAGFSSFFHRNFKSPESFGREGFSESVTVTFYLDKSGFANNIKVSGASNRDVEIEVMAVFRRMPAWNMHGYQSFGPITYTINLTSN